MSSENRRARLGIGNLPEDEQEKALERMANRRPRPRTLTVLEAPYTGAILAQKCKNCGWNIDGQRQELDQCPACQEPLRGCCSLAFGGLRVERSPYGNFKFSNDRHAAVVEDADVPDVIKFMLHHWRTEGHKNCVLGMALEDVESKMGPSIRKRAGFVLSGLFHSIACEFTAEAKASFLTLIDFLQEDDGSLPSDRQQELLAEVRASFDFFLAGKNRDALRNLWDWYVELSE